MPVPAPRLQRTLRLVLADPDRRKFVIVCHTKPVDFTLPTLQMRDQESVGDAAARYLGTTPADRRLRFGVTVGWRTTGPLFGVRHQERWLPVRLPTGSVPEAFLPPGSDGTWLPFDREATTEELRLAAQFAQGYWDGWLPEGAITLGD